MADDASKEIKTVRDLAAVHVAFTNQMKKENASTVTLTKALSTFAKQTKTAKATTDAQRRALAMYKDSLNKSSQALLVSVKDRFKEKNVVEEMSMKNLEAHQQELDADLKNVDFGTKADKQLMQSYKYRIDYEVASRKAQLAVIRAEEQGMLGMIKARYNQAGIVVNDFLRKWMGVNMAGSKTGQWLSKAGGIISILGIILGTVINSIKESTKEGSKALIDFGGVIGSGSNNLEDASSRIYKSMNKIAGDSMMSLDSVMENFNQSVENGALMMAYAQNQNTKVIGESRTALADYTMQQVTNMKEIGTAVFGMTDFMPQTLKTMKFYGTRFGKQMNTMMLEMGYIGQRQLRIGAGTLLDTMNTLGESLYMTGTTAESVIPSLEAIGSRFKEITGNDPEKIKALFQTLNDAVKQVSLDQQMALAPEAQMKGKTYGERALSALSESKLLTIARRSELLAAGSGEKKGSMAEAAVVMRGMSELPQTMATAKMIQGLLKTGSKTMEGKTNEQILAEMKASKITDAEALAQGNKILTSNVTFEEQLLNEVKDRGKQIVEILKELVLGLPDMVISKKLKNKINVFIATGGVKPGTAKAMSTK